MKDTHAVCMQCVDEDLPNHSLHVLSGNVNGSAQELTGFLPSVCTGLVNKERERNNTEQLKRDRKEDSPYVFLLQHMHKKRKTFKIRWM